jgi:hypothetical protein
MYQPTNAPKKLQSMTNINLLYFSTVGSHLQGGFQIKGIQTQQANLCMYRRHWDDLLKF